MSQHLIKRENWVLDKEAKDCNKCKQQFNVIVRRRHHCRSCGKVFCHECSGNFVDPSCFIDQMKEKKIRFCDFCYEEVKPYIEKKSIQQKQTKLAQSKSDDTCSQSGNSNQNLATNFRVSDYDTQMTSSIRIKTDGDQDSINDKAFEETEDLTTAITQLKQDLDNKISAVVESRTKESQIYDTWYKIICTYVKQSIHDIQLRLDDSMDVLKYIKIKKIPFHNYHPTQYMKGIVFRKNIANKKMQTKFNNPKILLIKGSFDSETTFDNLVKNEKKHIQQALESIDLLKPNIIFIEKSINVTLVEGLLRRNISAAINFSEDQLNQIALATGAKIQRAIDIFQKKFEVCLGKCDRIMFANYDPESIKNNKQIVLNEENKVKLNEHLEKHRNRDSTMLFISAPLSVKYAQLNKYSQIAITVSGPVITELKSVKSSLKSIIRLAYGMYLEKEFICLDLRFKNKIYRGISTPMVTCGDISEFIYTKSSGELNYDYMDYLKLKFIGADLSRFHDIQDANRETLQRYIDENLQNFNNKKIHYFSQLCAFNEKNIKFYDKSDQPLGRFLISKSHIEGNCQECKKKKISHIEVIYGPGAFVKIELERKNKYKLKLQQDQSQITHLEDSEFINQEIQEDTITQIAEEQHQDEDQTIDTYIQCKDCKQKLTEQIRLKKTHYQFSFHRFIQHLIAHTLKIKQSEQLTQQFGELEAKLIELEEKEGFSKDKSQIQTDQWLFNIPPHDCLQECKTRHKHHVQFERVFVHDQMLVKFYTNVFQVFRVEFINFKEAIRKISQSTLDVTISAGILQKSPEQLQQDGVRILINKCQSEKDMVQKAAREQLDLIKKSQQIQKAQKNSIIQKNIQRHSVQTDLFENTRSESPEDTNQENQDQVFFTKEGKEEWQQYSDTTAVIYQSIPISNQSDIGIVAYGLKSNKYQAIYQKNEFQYYFNNPTKQSELAKRLLLKVEPDQYLELKMIFEKQEKSQDVHTSPPNQFKLSEEEPSSNSLNEATSPAKEPIKLLEKIKVNNILIIYYPRQFECLRAINNISLERFIKSIASCISWDSSGGKSGSSFLKSADNLFIFKAIKESEFFMFDSFAPQYFQHMFNIHFENQKSVLNKIYGMFEIQHSKGTLYYIAMENLFYGLNDNLLVYDLKGSEAKRWKKKTGSTLLDTNYLIDRNGEPLPIVKDQYLSVQDAIVKDSQFLLNCDVVDYSLLLIIDKKNSTLRMGIIDYLQQYNLPKKLENRFKTVINLGFDPTIVKPTVYQQRFEDAMKIYFMGINPSL